MPLPVACLERTILVSDDIDSQTTCAAALAGMSPPQKKMLRFDCTLTRTTGYRYATGSGTRSLDFARDDVMGFSVAVTGVSLAPGAFLHKLSG